ncbi:hypothetical protein TCSYLVIO_007772 [Trypanosoma cruzi]|nr:hypothetical protein TCSYLVIO_007772 [Trypanosoma cruzi]
MSEYRHMLCALGVPARRCASDWYSSGRCLGSIHERSAKRPTDSCPITDPALDVRDIEGVIWKGESLSAMLGDEPSSWCLDTPPTNTTDARDPEETYLSAAMHAALRCLGMQVRLEVTEEGNARWVPCTDGATIAWAAPRYVERTVICRDHAQVCTISATSGRLLPVVPWDGEERACGAGRFHRHLPNKDCRGASVPVAESIETGRGTHRRMSTQLLLKHPSTEEKCTRPGCPDRPQEASLGGRDRSSETDGRQASDSR